MSRMYEYVYVYMSLYVINKNMTIKLRKIIKNMWEYWREEREERNDAITL